MKTLLASSGFINESIVQACEQLAEKPRTDINFIVINEAIKAETGDSRWLIGGLNSIAQNFGGTIELLDLQAHDLDYIEQRIALCDAIFCFGGNTDYLKEVFERTGFAKLLPRLLEEKVWVGSSAGSCVLCHKESKDITENIFQESSENPHFLNLLPLFFLPHFESTWFPQLTKSVALHESQLTNLPVYLMSDQSALIVTGPFNDHDPASAKTNPFNNPAPSPVDTNSPGSLAAPLVNTSSPSELTFTPVGTGYVVAQNGKVLAESATPPRREIHKKIAPEYFAAVASGQKTFEYRANDFDCSPGDLLILDEYSYNQGQAATPTGRSLHKRVGYIGKTKDFTWFDRPDVQKAISENGAQIISLLDEI